jgi:hypothetical protein
MSWRLDQTINGSLRCTEPAMREDDISELQNDRIRALEMVVGVLAKVIDATGNNVLNELRDVIDGRLIDLEVAAQLVGDAGGASRRTLLLARDILDEAPRRSTPAR